MFQSPMESPVFIEFEKADITRDIRIGEDCTIASFMLQNVAMKINVSNKQKIPNLSDVKETQSAIDCFMTKLKNINESEIPIAMNSAGGNLVDGIAS